MRLPPPQTEFYRSRLNALLWGYVARVYSDFSGTKEDALHVLGDMILALDPFPCQRCGTAVVNIAMEGTKLRCPECKWEPIVVHERTVTEISVETI